MNVVISGPTVSPEAGAVLRAIELPASSVTCTRYAPHLRIPSHAHTSAFIVFIRDGGFVEQHGSRRERCDRWSCLFRPPLDEHANDFEDRGAILTAMDVGGAWIDRLRDAGFNGERFNVRSPLVQQFGDRLDRELAAPDSMSAMVIEALATEVIALASRAKPARAGHSRWAERARRLIEHEFASSLSLANVASEVGVHPVHLARQFRASHGCTIGDYIRRVRVEFAQHRLMKSEEPIAEIALAAGFADQSQLTKSFRRVTGETPGAFRARRR